MERKIGKLLQETEFGMPLEHRQKQFNLDFQGAYDLRQIDIKHLKDARWDPTSLWTGALQDHKLNWDQLDWNKDDTKIWVTLIPGVFHGDEVERFGFIMWAETLTWVE